VWNGFLMLSGINALVAACALSRWPALPDRELWGTVLYLFPFLQLSWGVPMILVAGFRGRADSARGFTRAAALSFLAGLAGWGWFFSHVGMV